MFGWFKRTDAMQEVLDFMGAPEVREDVSCYLCTMPNGSRFITPDSDAAFHASQKGARVVGLPTVIWCGDVISNNSNDEGFDYGC